MTEIQFEEVFTMDGDKIVGTDVAPYAVESSWMFDDTAVRLVWYGMDCVKRAGWSAKRINAAWDAGYALTRAEYDHRPQDYVGWLVGLD